MTSPFSIEMTQSSRAGRTVRDIVEHDPQQVSEVWCRKIYRQVLQSLERQYAMQLPHRLITPDTVVFYEDGVPQVLPSLISDSAPDIADDLTALARIIHYAITQEVVPVRPLRGRALEGFSDSLLIAIDRSLAFDPAKRPRTIDELRELLGIVTFTRPPARGQTHTMQASPQDSLARQGGRPSAPALARPIWHRHWVWAGGGIAVLAGIGIALSTVLRDTSTFEHIAKTLPARSDAVRAEPKVKEPAPSATSPVAVPPADTQADAISANTATGGAQPVAGSTKQAPRRVRAEAAPSKTPALPRSPDAEPGTSSAKAQSAPLAPSSAEAAFDLQIQPWGVIYVDGVRRGVSPPVKQLTLAPGRHAIRISNPAAGDRVMEVDTAKGNGRIAVDFDSEPR
jgi:hypothetical protein